MRASTIIKKAAAEIGVTEYPPGSNRVKYNTDYYDGVVSGSKYPWCVAFVWWVFKETKASELFFEGKRTAYCPTVETWGYDKNLVVAKDEGRPGDLVLFDFNGQGKATHIGIIEKAEKDKYTTIEGNTSVVSDDNGGAVMRRIRTLGVIRCIIRPQYEPEVAAAPQINMSPKNVKEVQAYLNKFINANLELDGAAGPLTKKALIKYWQKVIGGLTIDGSFGPKSKAKASLNNLRKGDKGELVKIMQMGLILKGYGMGHYGADSSFGNYTEVVLKEFQKNRGLEADAVCGVNTLTALFK